MLESPLSQVRMEKTLEQNYRDRSVVRNTKRSFGGLRDIPGKAELLNRSYRTWPLALSVSHVIGMYV